MTKNQKETQDALMQFAGTIEIEERFRDKSIQEIRAMIASERQTKLDHIMKYTGKGSIGKQFDGLTSSDIREKRAQNTFTQGTPS